MDPCIPVYTYICMYFWFPKRDGTLDFLSKLDAACDSSALPCCFKFIRMKTKRYRAMTAVQRLLAFLDTRYKICRGRERIDGSWRIVEIEL